MTSYPPAPLAWQNKLALDYTHSQVAYVGYEGTVFHLSGPLAPVLGAQSGVVLGQSISGLMSPFKHLDNKGARQDGVTNYDSLYDEGEIDMIIELGGMNASDRRKVMAAWLGAWDPRKVGKLCWFSPERGEWVANVRLNKNIPDQIKSDWYQSGGLKLTWSARNDDAFWQGVDSVCNYNNTDNVIKDVFNRVNGSDLGTSNWASTNTGPGFIATPTAGFASWTVEGTTTGTEIVRKVGEGAISYSDNQFISVTLAEDFPTTGSPYIDIWGRVDDTGNYGIRARFGYSTVTVSVLSGGTLTQIWSGDYDHSFLKTLHPQAGDTLSLQCGVTEQEHHLLHDILSGLNRKPRQFQVFRNNKPLIHLPGLLAPIQEFLGADYGVSDSTSSYGPGFRGWGFGMEASGTGSTQIAPPKISKWSAGLDTGFITLTNIGDQPGWPRYLCYGPGTFLIGDGPDATNLISFGPLLDGQVAMLQTLPRLPAVVDMSPTAPDVQPTKFLKKIVEDLIDFATNNNIPPLLQHFESKFGIVPPQTNLYSLLDGRFTNSVPPMLEGEGPVTSHIACQIQGGSDKSKIVAALTPFRRWPE